ncbi:hypothetical protein J7E25_11015 [Agromyces sp. ISL-38]|nr:hypothetical protein [Agromyces sp. ISL-38]MBT2499627.1 hypothetical protein [Agromyces sp. ISL-38]MBT2516226.1 hypothetical protein [Streptomyces sp. ISL-90]
MSGAAVGPDVDEDDRRKSAMESWAIEGAQVDFEFGAAQPRVEGRCLPNG